MLVVEEEETFEGVEMLAKKVEETLEEVAL